MRSVRRFGVRKNIILEVSTEVRRKLILEGWLRVGWVSCRLEDYTEVPQCLKCFGFGHMAKWCKEEVHCIKCGGKGHIGKDCKVEKGQCVNCRSEGHSSRSRECSVYKAVLKAWIKSIDYGSRLWVVLAWH